MELLAKYDARNPAALRRLIGAGAQLRPFSLEILEAAYKAANEIYDEISAKNADFKKMYDSLREFRNEEYLWFQVAEYGFDTFMIRARSRG
jgi:TRAP-type mannitol/chloroaromatic compound transport system substrate-binding protein